ncbi:Pyruvate dehydrogenase E1 component subunit alpha type I, partial [Aphelenchoides avenae]
ASNAQVVFLRGFASNAEKQVQVADYKLFDLDHGPKQTVTITRDDALKYYRQMKLIRQFELTIGKLFAEQKMRGYCHQVVGEEGSEVGVRAAMDDGDSVVTSYRCHGWAYLMGSTTEEVIAECTGNFYGNSRGKGGSMHMYNRNFFGGHGIIGAQIALGTGVAFAHKYDDKKNVCFAIYGDGASNQGQFYESINMAKLWSLPVVYICENNRVGMGTPNIRSSASVDYYKHGASCNVPGIWVDGMDVLAVREAIRFAKEWCNSGKGPLVVELYTYRFVGHAPQDPGTTYRTREEVQHERFHDPLKVIRERVGDDFITKEDVEAIQQSVHEEVEAATKKALEQKFLPSAALLTDVYHMNKPETVRGTTPFDILTPKAINTDELIH